MFWHDVLFMMGIMYDRRRGKAWILYATVCRCHLSKRHSHWAMRQYYQVAHAFVPCVGGVAVARVIWARCDDGVRYVRKIFPIPGV